MPTEKRKNVKILSTDINVENYKTCWFLSSYIWQYQKILLSLHRNIRAMKSL